MARVTSGFIASESGRNAEINAILQRRMRQIIRLVAADARTNAPVDTGRMAQAIKEDPIVSNGPLRVVGGVTSHAPYSVFVHQGTRPHVIRPRNAAALRFQSGGATVFASSVNHPGTRARPFLTNAVARVLRDLT
jgi:hypothetical protein